MPSLNVMICIPVRNEARLLPRLLAALTQQDGCPSRFGVLFLFDGCLDESEEIIAAARQKLNFQVFSARLPAETANAGRARRAACQRGLEKAPAASFLLTTDADTLPASDWVRRNLEALEASDVVAGRISRRNAAVLPLRCRQETYLERLHRLRRSVDPIDHDPYPSHPCLGGASLAFRRSVYEALGGFPAIPSGEDTALVSAARRAGWRVRHDPRVQVVTSARTLGRAPSGLACELAGLPDRAEEILVPDPEAAVHLYRFQYWLRKWFLTGDSLPLPSELPLRLFPDRLVRLLCAAPSADAFVEAASSEIPPLPELGLEQAEKRLDTLETALLNPAVAA